MGKKKFRKETENVHTAQYNFIPFQLGSNGANKHNNSILLTTKPSDMTAVEIPAAGICQQSANHINVFLDLLLLRLNCSRVGIRHGMCPLYLDCLGPKPMSTLRCQIRVQHGIREK